MLRAAVIFFALALSALFLGAYHIADVSAEIGQLFLFVFAVFGVVSLLGHMVISVQQEEILPIYEKLSQGQEGRIGYLILWLLGVPSSVLLIIFLIRGH